MLSRPTAFFKSALQFCSVPKLPLILPLLAQAKRSQCWHQREAPSTTQDLWKVPEQTSDGEDFQASIWFHCAQDQVNTQTHTLNTKLYIIWAIFCHEEKMKNDIHQS